MPNCSLGAACAVRFVSPGGYDWIGLDFYLNLGALFQLHLAALLVSERIGYADFAVEMIRAFH